MISSKVDFPYPLLAHGFDDFVDSELNFNIDFENADAVDGAFYFRAVYDLRCPGLQKMLENKTAKAVIILESSAASYRKIFEFEGFQNAGVFSFPADSVVKNITLTCCVVATAAIPNYSLPEFNPEYYADFSVAVQKGDILARALTETVNLDDSELEKPLSSIFSILRNDELNTMMFLNFEDEKIEVSMKPELYGLYYELRSFNNGSFRRYLSGIVVLPALTEAIDKIIGNEQSGDERSERMADKRWYRAIRKKASTLGQDLGSYTDSSASLASCLLGDVVYDALSNFKATIEDEMGGHVIERIGGDD